MARIAWRRQAQDDLDEIFRYVLEVQPAAAWRLRDAIMRQVEFLAEHPALGRPGRVPGTRELVVASTPYIVGYTFDTRRDRVLVLVVIHGAQLWPAEF